MSMYVTFYTILYSAVVVVVVSKEYKECQVIFNDAFSNCSNRTNDSPSTWDSYETSLQETKAIQHGKGKETCINKDICDRILKITRINKQSFSSKTLVHISDMLDQCCGRCSRYTLISVPTDLSDVDASVLNYSDIIYPVIGRWSFAYKLYGFYYIPVFDVPNAYYFTLRMSKQKMAFNVIIASLNMWPLFAICLLLNLISGFIIWVIEARKNRKEFARSFHLGLIDGFWWSFVSMTTVGYGDKSPKSFVGRMFAVFWILIGITTCSIFTASLTSEIMNVQSSTNTNMDGKIVGALKHRLPDAIMIAQHEGILRNVEYTETVIGIVEMIKMLQNKSINGFLINRATLHYFSRQIKSKKYADLAESIRGINMIPTEKFFRRYQLVTGILVKHYDDYQYFKKYFEDNWLHIQTCFSFNMESRDQMFESTPYTMSTVEGLFHPFLHWTLAIIAIVFFFGVFYEIRRHSKKNLKKAPSRRLSSIRRRFRKLY